MAICQNDVATISLQELHDILASQDFSVPCEDDPSVSRTVVSFKLQDEGENNTKAQEIVSKMNKILEQMQELDTEFHEEFNCQYC